MTRIPDRDESVDQLLRAIHSGDATGPSKTAATSCPDASELAAWADTDLEPNAAAIVEAHLATCARCQVIVATLVRTAPAPAVVLPFWRRPSIALPIVSMAAAAAAVLAIAVWSKPGRTRVPAAAVTTVAEATPPLAAPPAPAVQQQPPAQLTAGEPASPAPRASTPVAHGDSGPERQVPARPNQTLSANAAAQGDMTLDQASRAPGVSGKPTGSPPSAVQAAPPAPVVAVPPPPPPTSAVLAAPPPPPALPQFRAASAAPGRVVAESPLVDTKKTATGGQFTNVDSMVADFTSGSDTREPFALPDAAAAALAGGRAGAGGGARTTPAALPVRWRITSSGEVGRSLDGATWLPVPLDPGQHPVAGVAPSPQVCWLVGQAGLVLLMTNGQDFKVLTRPTSADLRFVRIEGNRVVVSAVDGTSFATTDQGRTWTLERLLQGFQPRPF